MFKSKSLGLRIAFQIRTKKPAGMVTLYGRLSIGSTRSAFYSVGVSVPVDGWRSKEQKVDPAHPKASEINKMIEEVRLGIEEVYLQQKVALLPNGTPLYMTVHTVLEQWRTQKTPVPVLTLTEVFDEYMRYLGKLHTDERKAAKTMKAYLQAGKYMNAFLRSTKQVDLPADSVTGGWARRFHDWMRTNQMSCATATRYFMVIKSALQHAYNYDRIKDTPLDSVRFKGDRRKPIYSLDVTQMNQLATLELSGTIDHARNWALLMCYTGLDYHDALRVVKNLNTYWVDTENGPKLVYQRLKFAHAPQWGECHIPLVDKALELLQIAHTWKCPRLRNENGFLNELGDLLDLPFSFSSKVCRKTAGAMFLREGYDIYGVQKILGHQSVKVTESHYCNLPGELVDRQMKEVSNRQRSMSTFASLHTPFRRVA